MMIYKNREIRDELLSKLEEFEPSSEFSELMGWDFCNWTQIMININSELFK